MSMKLRPWLASLAISCVAATASAQTTAPAPAAKAPVGTPIAAPAAAPVAAANAVAATVNGQPLAEVAVQRGLKRVPPDKQGEARPEILNYLIDNLLVDQYLQQMKVAVDPKDVDKRLGEMKEEVKKASGDFAKLLQEWAITEAELKEHVSSDLRWEKFIEQQATDKNLKALFDGGKDMFDGSMARARHVLLSPDMKDAKAVAQARADLEKYKKQVNDQAAAGVAKLPATTQPLDKEKERQKLVEAAFSQIAKEKSACPSGKQGGDVGWFDRAGTMVEPFAKAAFALKSFEMSEIVESPFGLHLILGLDKKPGKEVKFEDVKNDVKEVYGDKLREAVIAQMRKTAKISIAGKQ